LRDVLQQSGGTLFATHLLFYAKHPMHTEHSQLRAAAELALKTLDIIACFERLPPSTADLASKSIRDLQTALGRSPALSLRSELKSPPLQ
jgi:hypothetical protein